MRRLGIIKLGGNVRSVRKIDLLCFATERGSVMEFKHRCEIAQKCLPDSEYKNSLIKLHNELLQENDNLRCALLQFAQNNAWVAFGEVRAYGDLDILTSAELDSIARKVLYGTKE